MPMCATVHLMRSGIKVNGKQIRRLRENAGYDATQFAGKLGITRGHVSHIETGRKNPSPSVLLAIANLLGKTVEELRV